MNYNNEIKNKFINNKIKRKELKSILFCPDDRIIAIDYEPTECQFSIFCLWIIETFKKISFN